MQTKARLIINSRTIIFATFILSSIVILIFSISLIRELLPLYQKKQNFFNNNPKFSTAKLEPKIDLNITSSEERYYIDQAIYVIESRTPVTSTDKLYEYKINDREHYYELPINLKNLGENSLNINLILQSGRTYSTSDVINKVNLYNQKFETRYIEGYEDSRVIGDINAVDVVVDNKTKVPANYIPGDLVSLSSMGINTNGEMRLREEAAIKLKEMLTDLSKAKINYLITSAFRTYQSQIFTYNAYIFEKGEAAAAKVAARPGYSEHQLGLAVDILNEETNYQLPSRTIKTRLYSWLLKNASKYGYYQTYKGDTEGIIEEIWHWRYTGVID